MESIWNKKRLKQKDTKWILEVGCGSRINQKLNFMK